MARVWQGDGNRRLLSAAAEKKRNLRAVENLKETHRAKKNQAALRAALAKAAQSSVRI